MKRPDLILCGDIHLREDTPVARVDDYWEAQARKILWLSDLQRECGCPILDSGDLFNAWKASPFLLQWAINNLPDSMIGIPGNHDLPAHNLDLYEKSGLGVLGAAGKMLVLTTPNSCFLDLDLKYKLNAAIHPFPWGAELKGLSGKDSLSNFPEVAVVHAMTYTGRVPYPGCKDLGATALLKKMGGYDLVVTGHNHKPIVIEHEGRLLVNPGSLMRSTADQADHEPRVYLWYAEDNRVEPVFVPIEKDVISRNHLDVVEDREARISAFVERLGGEFEVSLGFRNNLQNFFGENRVRKAVQDLVWGAVDGNQ